ncbi:hypothetical protein DBV15_01398 [Temnothorax longispinosus]|uniref:Uncharacterized protein n=1 Tax=Temnothorax longispinosus TaxID=300112 RepID=A0A4S2KZF3_9HYME|nr:hypothetical protein DBV15_01398 [Temnothorax longispinosus]
MFAAEGFAYRRRDTRHERTSERDATRRDATRRYATLIYHASTYDVDGSRMLRDKTDRRQLAVAFRFKNRGPAKHVTNVVAMFLFCVALIASCLR